MRSAAVLAGLCAVVAGCGAARPEATADGGADGLAAPAVAAPPEPYGAAALTALARLPILRLDTLAAQESSFDRSGGNADGQGASNFLDEDGGEKVMVDLAGPGVVYTMWFTGFGPGAWIRVYFDGEPAPRLDLPLVELFTGARPPFVWPLVAGPGAASGGFVSSVPLPFARAIRITTNGAGKSFYYHVGYHLFPADRPVASFTGAEDTAAARRAWTAPFGAPPAAGAVTEARDVEVAPGGEATLLDTDGPGVITAVRLRLPGVGPGEVTDTGRAHRGESRFTARLDPANAGVVLRRRYEAGRAPARARVLVDGVAVGTWTDAADAAPGWRDGVFTIPAKHTAGRAAVEVRLEHDGGDGDWREFRYWVAAVVGGEAVTTDVLDVGDPGAEAAHGYAVSGATWAGRRTLAYPGAGDGRDVLNGLRLRAWWDGAAEPAVDAPLGAFFGLGQFGTRGATVALTMGMDETGELYAYFPLPFRRHARLALASERAVATAGVACRVTRAPAGGDLDRMGMFRTAFTHEVRPGGDQVDLTVLEAAGAGHLVGVVQSVRGGPGRAYLEGDERILVDGRATPAFLGTGTEDFYQGGWYFAAGPFSRPTHGNPAHVVEDDIDGTVGYRLFLADAIPFRAGIAVSLEHGNRDLSAVEAWTLAYYYHRPAGCRITDELDVGAAASEGRHDYRIAGARWSARRTARFEGDWDGPPVTDDGRAHAGASAFTLAVDPRNEGVLLRRRFDQRRPSAAAEVWVEGVRAGVWRRAGSNPAFAWREDDFLVPAALTRGRARIRVELRVTPSDGEWNEFRYWALSCPAP